MNSILKNKKTLLTILIALVFGVLIGWLVKPSAEYHENQNHVHQHDDATDNQIWTCSMHPQIRSSEPGQCPLCGMDLIPASSNGSKGTNNPMVYEMTPESVAMANIHTTRVSGVSPEGEIHLTGKVEVDERQITSITAKYPGRIDELHVNFTGQVIRPGNKLATIYSPELITAQKELLEAKSTKDTYPELYAAAREKLRLWKLTERQIDNIEKSGRVKDQFEVLANKGGVVTERNISVGDYVNTGSTLFEVVDLSKVWIMIDAYETDLSSIKQGDEITFTAAGVPGKAFTAKITYIDPIINPDTRTVSIRAEAINENGDLKPKMFVNARIHTRLSPEQSTVAIPRTALLWSGKRSIVYVKVEDSEFPAYEMREITIGPRMGEMYLVEAGLEAGEEIVSNGVFAIDAAAQLAGNYSMLNRPQTKTIEVSQAFREQITAVAEAYFEVKNGLVNDNSKAASASIGKVQKALEHVEMQNLEQQAHDHWLTLKDQLSSAVDMMSDAEDLAALREHFARLSEGVLEMTELFGLEKDKVYKQYCPMAFDNEGAFWLSETEEIHNPYFGETMHTCGEGEATYRRGQRVFVKDGPPKSTGAHNH